MTLGPEKHCDPYYSEWKKLDVLFLRRLCLASVFGGHVPKATTDRPGRKGADDYWKREAGQHPRDFGG